MPRTDLGLIVDGRRILVPGTEVVTWLDGDPRVTLATDGRRRTGRVVGIVLHTVHGRLGPLRTTCGPSQRAEAYARYQTHALERDVSWHITIDTDGTVVQSADPVTWTAWHAGHVNAGTVGIELVQGEGDAPNALCGDQMGALVRLLDVLCAALDVPRVTPTRGGAPYAGLLDQDVFHGVYGHRNVWTIKDGRKLPVRGAGDPTDHPFRALLAAGYAGLEIPPQAAEHTVVTFVADLDTRREAQARIGVASDGVWGPLSRAACVAFQRAHGLAATGLLDAATWAMVLATAP